MKPVSTEIEMMRTAQIGLRSAIAVLLLVPSGAFCQQNDVEVALTSSSGLNGYAQGGVVVDGVAYFTANDLPKNRVAEDEDFHRIVAFDVHTLKKLKTYRFSDLYDSSPLVLQKKDGTWLVIAHEHKQGRTVAMNRDSGEAEWTSAPNQPGSMFFGYSYFTQEDNAKLVLMACANGLHAISSETGEDAWWVRRHSSGGVTPCVDQANGWIFYQCDGELLKIRAADGKVLKSVHVAKPSSCISWNTLLANDSHGCFVATYWYSSDREDATWDSAVRVFDTNLHLVWERTDLPLGKKATLTYADGKLVSGCGNQWRAKYKGNNWKNIVAYAIGTGDVVWKCDLSMHEFTCILNVPYYNGCFYAETQDYSGIPSKLFRINGADGELAKVLTYHRAITSCAPCIVAAGQIFSGDIFENRIVITRIAENSRLDWPGPFGNPQTNQMTAGQDPRARPVAMQEIGR